MADLRSSDEKVEALKQKKLGAGIQFKVAKSPYDVSLYSRGITKII